MLVHGLTLAFGPVPRWTPSLRSGTSEPAEPWTWRLAEQAPVTCRLAKGSQSGQKGKRTGHGSLGMRVWEKRWLRERGLLRKGRLRRCIALTRRSGGRLSKTTSAADTNSEVKKCGPRRTSSMAVLQRSPTFRGLLPSVTSRPSCPTSFNTISPAFGSFRPCPDPW